MAAAHLYSRRGATGSPITSPDTYRFEAAGARVDTPSTASMADTIHIIRTETSVVGLVW